MGICSPGPLYIGAARGAGASAARGLGSVAEAPAEQAPELVVGEPVILRPGMSDLDRTHERGDATARLPVEPVQPPVEQARTVGVPAARRIARFARAHHRYLDRPLPGVDPRALGAERD